MSDLSQLDATAQAELVRKGDVSPLELVDAAINNIEKVNPEFTTPDEPFLGFMRAATFVPYTPLANMAGNPAISLPLAWNDQDLPIGSMLMSAYGREDVLLRVAAQCEAARPWADRRPPVHD